MDAKVKVETLSERIERALALLASAEGDSDEVVRDLGRTHMMLNNAGQHIHSENCQRAASHILALQAKLANLRGLDAATAGDLTDCKAELASVKAERDALDQKLWELKHPSAAIPRAAHPKDAP